MDKISQKVTDKNGNFLTIMMSGNVFLRLGSKQQRERRIGYIDRAKKTFVVERKRERHLFHKMNAYGFNEHFLKKSKSFDKVLLNDDYGSYEIPVSDILSQGKNYLHFKQKGFELQIFVPIEILNLYQKSLKFA